MAQPHQLQDAIVRVGVGILSLATIAPVFCVMYSSASVFASKAPAAAELQLVVISLGTLIASGGLALATICLLLRLRYQRNDLVQPPSLVPALVITLLGASVAVAAFALSLQSTHP